MTQRTHLHAPQYIFLGIEITFTATAHGDPTISSSSSSPIVDDCTATNTQDAFFSGSSANVTQLPEQSQHSFSIPTADVEEASAVLSGNGMYIGQRAHLRDIESCISALRLAQTITLEYAIEKLLAERDRVLINPHY
ncbi:hypothetical protein V491_02958 [Pseudogymnoascus sp. VKM F-3775]|nr:hypothetical protein V491_02958 [Pseudogymnoascus sp. VKM F-3775]